MEKSELDAHLERINKDGYTILERVIESELVSEVVTELDRIERDQGIVPAKNLFEGSRTVRIYNLLVHGKVFERIPAKMVSTSMSSALNASVDKIATGSTP